MRTLALFLSLFIIAGATYAQENQTITINSRASVEVPADRIAFNIQINAEADGPQEAFDLQKKREQMLIELLKKHQIKEENIQFDPISISKINQHRKEVEQKIRTRQEVTLSITDFSKYEQIQLSLIDNGFDEFNGQFKSSEAEQARDDALIEALEEARRKAELIANQSGLTLKGVKSIDYSNHAGPRPVAMRDYVATAKESNSMISEYDQTVSISAAVSVQYHFGNTTE
ncbi:MAG TPA: SIMPL domain-containing protein [Fodinibius sp.]|nr:SIMPL domain-containing protein [Fodinibius sp.]